MDKGLRLGVGTIDWWGVEDERILDDCLSPTNSNDASLYHLFPYLTAPLAIYTSYSSRTPQIPTPTPSKSIQHRLHKPLLQPPYLPLKPLHLLPTIQRSPIPFPQTLHQLPLRPLHALIPHHLLFQLPLLQFPLQRLNLFLHCLPAQIAAVLAVSAEGGLETARTGGEV
jgi:hypothetical protein